MVKITITDRFACCVYNGRGLVSLHSRPCRMPTMHRVRELLGELSSELVVRSEQYANTMKKVNTTQQGVCRLQIK